MRSQGTVRRLALAIALAALLPLATATSVLAKMPYFTVEIDPAVPTAGEQFLVIVRTWEDADHSIPAGFADAEALGGLLVARRPGGAGVAIPLLLRGPDRFEARVTLPAGDWTLVAFPDRSGWSSPNVPVGYPDTIPLRVRERAPTVTGLAAGLIIVLGALLSIALIRRHRLKRGTRGLSGLHPQFPG